MFSTGQQKAFTHPTARKSPHHSQVPFDFEDTFIVKAVQPPVNTAPTTWTPKHSRQCWTTGNLTKSRSKPVLVKADFPYVRAYTMVQPSETHINAATTAVLPKTGQVKITALEKETTTLSSSSVQNSTTSSTRFVASKRRREKTRFLISRPVPRIHDITIGDLQQAIDTEFPEIQGVHYNKGSNQPRVTTARPLGFTSPHSRVSSMKDPRKISNLNCNYDHSYRDSNTETTGPKPLSEPETECQAPSKIPNETVSRAVSRAQSTVEAKPNSNQDNLADENSQKELGEELSSNTEERCVKIPIDNTPINIPTSTNEED